MQIYKQLRINTSLIVIIFAFANIFIFMSINERFQQIINNLYSGNKRAFSREIGVSPTVIENIVGKRQGKPSFEVTNKTVTSVQNLDAEWLLTGKGTMLKPEYKSTETKANMVSESMVSYNTPLRTIPLLRLDNVISLHSLFSDTTGAHTAGEICIPDAPLCDGAIYVKGDSMYPILKSGDIICYKIIHNIASILWGEMYLMEIDNEGEQYITIKYILKSDVGDDHILLTSENCQHEPIHLLKTSVKVLALIKASIRYNCL